MAFRDIVWFAANNKQEMPMKLKDKVPWLTGKVQRGLFSHLDECLVSPLTKQEKRLVKILELVQIEKHVPGNAFRQWLGRPIKEREFIARAFVAKTVLGYLHTRSLVNGLNSTPNFRAICGFGLHSKVPSEATFSRAFAEFAECGLGTIVHDILVKEYLGDQLLGHVSRDSTAIKGREKPVKKEKKPKVSKKKGRPAANEKREPEKTRIEVQRNQSAKEAIAELPILCDRGVKKNSKGYTETWNGYKLHVDVCDSGFPLSAVLTSASVHDSQVAIPLMKMTSSELTYFYEVMDAAYDAESIREQCIELGHIPIIDRNSRGGDVIPMAPHEAQRYKERTAAERFNSRLKESFGGRNVMVKGASKVMMHLMFGVMVVFADQIIKLLKL